VMSVTEHKANNSVVWVSDKVWNSLTDEQKGWVQAAADQVSREQPAKSFALEHDSLKRLQKLGVTFVTDVDKTGFIKIAQPLQDQSAQALGPHAVKILGLIRSIE